MSQNKKNMQYLSVNTEDYLRPLRPAHRRISRSISPGLDTMESLDECESDHNLRKTASSKSLLMLHKFTSSDSNLSTTDSTTSSRKAFYKSTENLCFVRPKKHLRRQEQVSEVYRPRPRCNTDPVDVDWLREKRIPVPILSVPPTSNSACSSLANSAAPTPLLGRKHHQRRSSALSSLIEQALKVTTASVGLKSKTEERLTQQQATTKSANDDNVKRRLSSVSTFAATPNDSTSMAPLQSHAETQSVTTLNLHEKDSTASPLTSIGSNSSNSNSAQKQKQLQRHQRNNSNQSDYYTAAYSATISDSNGRGEGRSLNPLAPSESTTSVRSISPTSRKSATSSNWSSHTTAKHEQSTAAATAAAAAATTTVPAEKEKEKKRKEVSSSRVKKFHRHFTQVSKDEKLINYFSCALVSDILLQGHLYITDQHFAFYSNVFGYVTKVVIPTSSVTKISKEKTAKIIPNAVGVATADERHVFGSFISREAAFRLMCSVCPPLAPAEILPKIPAEIEISEEYSIEDDSSCSISGNESPPQALVAAAAAAAAGGIDGLGQTLIRRNVASSSLNIADGKAATCEHQRHSAPPVDAKQAGAYSNSGAASPAARSGQPLNADGTNASCSNDAIAGAGIALIVAGTASSTSASSSPTPSTSSSLPTTVMAATSSSTPKSAAHAAVSSFKRLTQKALLRLKFPTELHVVYLGVLLTMVLALFSVFLLYRILDIEAKTSAYRTPTEFHWQRSGNDDDIFAEALRWQRELQAKSTEEAQNILTQNLEQIAKVRRSLETLSMLIHDRSSAYADRDDSD
ncbi:PREDICTED: serine-rich adhesin for platelets-like isoform X3 [Rhagoletis zephyria]|uniref:serine-rich adhesin for platelets-like isoform X3 n=1 Tax=Rhagoletis zephyria TaxID=28612 RepID=UPI0008117D0B|nr:PREDICTED: serine-rich adhesin for platelets-like isoform X3 [Rhagoletis zephyria]